MTIKDLFHETSSALLGNKVRSSLTMLGIVIGIASVIAMLAIGKGATNSIQSSIQSLGSNLIIVSPGAQRGPGFQVSTGRGAAQSLTLDDATAIKKSISEVSAAAPEVTSRKQVVAKGTNTNTSVIGTVPDYTVVRNLEIDEGSFITDENVASLAKVAVIGPTTRDDLFGVGGEAMGQSIRINGAIFKIIGVTKSKGGSGFNNPDDAIYVPISVAQQIFTGNKYVTAISVQADTKEDMTLAQNDITSLLLARHNISNPALADFSTINQSDIVSAASTVTNTLSYLLASVAGISLVVGGIGIMNMMLTTVTERTREIGLRKAIGAKKGDISNQFLVEAVLLTMIGGTVGVVLGWLIAFGISSTGILQASMSISSILLAFGVSAGIGIAFGYYPARRASGLNPIEALRYE
ncbi:MAG: ABC transporter permease [Candidatus Pacebacteria bacterium]|nr:ABC transporter permease [Candidatus Paceibacterota bacterium]